MTEIRYNQTKPGGPGAHGEGMAPRGQRGFTLIELMVAMALSLILVGAILQTFQTAMDVFERGTARMEIYSNIRSAMSVMERDLSGMVPTDTGGQRFVLAQNVDGQFPEDTTDRFGAGGGQGGDFGRTNGWIMEDGTRSQPNGGAADMIGFIGETNVGGQQETVGVMYQIAPIRDPSLLDTELGAFRTVRHNRILTALKRVVISPASEINGHQAEEQEEGGDSGGGDQGDGQQSGGNVGLYYGPNGPGGEMWNPQNTGLDAQPGAGQGTGPQPRQTSLGYLAQYILSFNIEVMPDNQSDNGFIDLNARNDTEQQSLTEKEQKYLNPNENFSQSQFYPIGDGSEGDPDLPDAIRVTIRFTNNRAEDQERVVQRVFWIPVE